MSRLPLITAVKIEVESLAAVESIALGEADDQSWSHASRGLARKIRLHVKIIRLVEDTIELQVERIALGRRVTRGEIKVDKTEQPTCRKTTER